MEVAYVERESIATIHTRTYTLRNSYTSSIVDKLDFCKKAHNHVDVRKNYARPGKMIKYIRRTWDTFRNGERRLRAQIKRIFFYIDNKTKISFKIIQRKNHKKNDVVYTHWNVHMCVYIYTNTLINMLMLSR